MSIFDNHIASTCIIVSYIAKWILIDAKQNRITILNIERYNSDVKQLEWLNDIRIKHRKYRVKTPLSVINSTWTYNEIN